MPIEYKKYILRRQPTIGSCNMQVLHITKGHFHYGVNSFMMNDRFGGAEASQVE